MDEIDRLIAKSKMEAAEYESIHFNPKSSPGTTFTPVYLFSTRHGFHILGLDDSPSTLDLVANARQVNADLCDPMITAAGFHHALESLVDRGDNSQNAEVGIAAYFYSRATSTWRLVQERLKQVPDATLKPHFFVIQYHHRTIFRPAAMLDERELIPAEEALEFVVSVIAEDRHKHPEYFRN